jgi:hypothetical protein
MSYREVDYHRQSYLIVEDQNQGNWTWLLKTYIANSNHIDCTGTAVHL